jgi:MFS family permease
LLILALPNSSPAVAGFAGALERLPYVLFSLPAGALVDRWERKRSMIICAIGLTFCITSIPIALLTGYLSILLIYLIAFTIGTLGLFYELAELAALTHVVPKTQLPTAVAQNEAVYSTVSLLAPSLSGLLFSIGRLLPFVTDAISYLVLLGSLVSMHIPFQGKRDETPHHFFREIREGMSWLWSHAVVRHLAFLAGYLYVVWCVDAGPGIHRRKPGASRRPSNHCHPLGRPAPDGRHHAAQSIHPPCFLPTSANIASIKRLPASMEAFHTNWQEWN